MPFRYFVSDWTTATVSLPAPLLSTYRAHFAQQEVHMTPTSTGVVGVDGEKGQGFDQAVAGGRSGDEDCCNEAGGGGNQETENEEDTATKRCARDHTANVLGGRGSCIDVEEAASRKNRLLPA